MIGSGRREGKIWVRKQDGMGLKVSVEKNKAYLNRCDSFRKKNVSREVKKKLFQKYVDDMGLIKNIFMRYLCN